MIRSEKLQIGREQRVGAREVTAGIPNRADIGRRRVGEIEVKRVGGHSDDGDDHGRSHAQQVNETVAGRTAGFPGTPHGSVRAEWI